MHEMLDNGDNIWVAPTDQVTPYLEVKFARNEFDRGSLKNALTARIGGKTIPIGPLELQIAYKLYLGAQKTSRMQSTSTRSSRKVLVCPASKSG